MEDIQQFIFVEVLFFILVNNEIIACFFFWNSEQTTRVMWSYKVENWEFVCAYCLKTFTNPVKLPCGYNLCEECVLEWREEINWERDKGIKWRRRVWGYCEEWYLKREREWEWENWVFEWMKWMDDWFWCVNDYWDEMIFIHFVSFSSFHIIPFS